MNKNNEVIEGLVVLEYLNIGIMPFYPGQQGITTADRKTKRKFRKMWRKVATLYNSIEYYSLLEGKKYPSKSKMYKRKMIVHTYITAQVKKKYGLY
tara:strand:+ start:437 stop:724 length:288 start_codon:yes stop_codon:yes gene_type:complete